jgi:hypothetical protein
MNEGWQDRMGLVPNLPNALTLVRLALAPLIAWLLLQRHDAVSPVAGTSRRASAQWPIHWPTRQRVCWPGTQGPPGAPRAKRRRLSASYLDLPQDATVRVV